MRTPESLERPPEQVPLADAHHILAIVPGRDKDYREQFDLALSYHERQDYEQAIAHYTSCIELNPQISDAYVNRGAAYASTDYLNLALQDLNVALDLEAKAPIYVIRGMIHSKKGDHDKAIMDYSRAIKLDPNDASAYSYRGHSHRWKSDNEQAIRDYGKALALEPEDADPYVSIGYVHYLLADHERAIQYFDKALALNTSDPYTHLYRGASHSAQGDLDSAIDDFGKALALDPNNFHAYSARALVLIGSGEFARAFRDLDEALKLKPDLAYIQGVRGSLYLAGGDSDRAIHDLGKAVALDPNNSNAYNDLGVAYEGRGEFDRAMHNYEMALSLKPNKAAYANRGMGLLRLSEWERARSDLLRARNMGMDIVAAFRRGNESVATFEGRYNLKLPQGIADMISIEEAQQQTFTGESVIETFSKIRKSAPNSASDDLPPDGSSNYRHYLYSWPRD